MNQINRYQILAPLGRGGMALVYRAYDPHFKREVAIKVIASHFSHDPEFRQRFSNEAQVIALLQHPAIVPVYDFGEENGQPYLVMALMQGGSLTERLQHGPLSLQQTIQLLRGIAPALDLAHQKGIVHRDLKPDNILFDGQNNPYIADFGIAKLLLQSSMGLSQSGIGIGTPFFMSPQQARGEKNIDGRSDIYSLGVMGFYMLTGQYPYDADTPLGIAYKHIHEPIPNIRLIRADLPPGCETVMAHAMAKNPDERYATVSQMVAALDAVAKGTYQSASVTGTTAQPLSHGHVVTQPQTVVESPVSPSTPMVSAIIGTILGLILLITIGLMMNSARSEPPIVVNPGIDAVETGNRSDLTQVVPTTPSDITVTPDVPEEDEPVEVVTPDPSITMTTEVEPSNTLQTATAQGVPTFEAQQTVTTEGQSDDAIATITAQAAIDAEATQQAARQATDAQQATQTAAAAQTAQAQGLAAAAATQAAGEAQATAEAQAGTAAQATQQAQAAADAQATQQAQAAADAQVTQQAQAAADAQVTQQAQA
ncbi:MAG: serine/threonine-protein kinase, partial [Ardenticatenaceae bacterium]